MKTIWNQTCRIPRRNELPGNLDTEVAIIGGGLAGILLAFYLAQEGKQAVVLEASSIGSGQTKGTTAKITSQHNLIYQKLLTDFGESARTLMPAPMSRPYGNINGLLQPAPSAAVLKRSRLFSIP